MNAVASSTLNCEGVSKLRLILLRIFYVLIFVVLGLDVWPANIYSS